MKLARDDEDAVRRLLGLLDRIGDRSGALTAYEEFATRLRVQQNLEPAAETCALMDTIRKRVLIPGATTEGRCPPHSVAVLPFLNLSTESDDRYFSDGMTEEILNALTKSSGLKVASRTSAFAFEGKNLDVREIAERLSVRTVLEGSVRRAGTRVRITAQLINAADGYHQWSETYDREMTDVFAIQDEISRAIVAALKTQLGGQVPGKLVTPRTANLETYELYLKGRFFWNTRTPEGFHHGIHNFEKAVQIDPGYSLPYTGLADCYHLLALYGIMPPAEAYPRSKAAALRALEIDDHLAEGHSSLGCVALAYEWDWPAAERAFRRAIELDPKYVPAHHWYAWLLVALKRGDEAVAIIQRAVELEPLSPIILSRAGHILYYTGRITEALRYCERALELDPSYPLTHEVLALIYSSVSRYEDAITALEHLGSRPPSKAAPVLLPYVQAMTGKLAEARFSIENLGFDPDAGRFPAGYLPLWVSATYALLDDLDQAFRWLRLMYEERTFSLILCHVEPGYERMRRDPRFHYWLGRVGLPL